MLRANRESLAQAFERMDRNGNGVLSRWDFKRGLESLQIEGLSEDVVELILAEIDRDGDEHIDYAEFCDMFRSVENAERLADEVTTELRRRLQGRNKDLLNAFEECDINGDGVLSAAEMQRSMQKLGMELTKDDMAQLMAVIDQDLSLIHI